MRRVRLLITSGIAGIGLLLALALPLVAATSVSFETSGTAASLATEMPLAPQYQSGVRSLPLVLAGGIVDLQFAGGTNLSDTARVQAALVDLAPRIGLNSKTITSLLSTEPTFGSGYPYTYEPYDRIVASTLTISSTKVDQRAVIDFATLAAATAQLKQESWAAALAYSVLKRASTIRNSCDIQTEIEFLVSEGMEPAYANVAREAEQAEQLCPNDPTPQWLLAKFAATQATVTDEIRTLAGSGEERRRLAERAFADLRQSYPNSPVGWAGAADLYLSWADLAETHGSEPFQVRRWRKQAADLYHVVRQRFSDPRLAVGHARALSALGENAQAVQLVDDAAAQLPANLPTSIVRSDILSRSGAHGQAAEAIADEKVTPAWWIIGVPSLVHDFMSGAYGGEELPQLILLDAARNQYGGGSVIDLSFIPHHRNARVMSFCRNAKRMEELLMAHRGAEIPALLARDTPLTEVIPGLQCSYLDSFEDEFFSTADLDTYASLDQEDSSQADSEHHDRWQDLLRSADQWDRARSANDAWAAAEPSSGIAWQRSGEVAYLTGDDQAAANMFEKASQLFQQQAARGDSTDAWEPLPSQQSAWAELQRGAATERQGQIRDAVRSYQSSIRTLASAPSDDYWTDYLVVHVRSQLGRRALLDGRLAEAVDEFTTAIATGRLHDEVIAAKGGRLEPTADGPLQASSLGQINMLHGAQENNLALTYAKLGSGAKAVSAARDAHTRDPESPIFTDTLAFALQTNGENDDAIQLYRAALDRDQTSYASANNLAVLLGQAGQTDAARRVLIDILGAKSDYALAWHNLGTLDQGAWSLHSFIRSQGELGRAASLSVDLRNANLQLMPDTVIYDAGFDVSRPVPANWTYASSATLPATHWTIAIIALLAIRVAVLVVSELVGGRLSEWLLDFERAKGVSWLHARWAGFIAIATTIVVLVGRQQLLQPSIGTSVLLLATTSMVALAVTMRSLREPRASQTTTPLAVAVAFASGLVGFPFAPFPSLSAKAGSLRRFSLWIAPAVVGAVLAICTATLIATGVPAARSLALAAATLLGSIFIAVPPMDGSQIKGRLINLLVSGLLLSAAIVYGIPLV